MNRWMLGLCASLAIAGCNASAAEVSVVTVSPTTAQPVAIPGAASEGFSVGALGLTFRLPSTFHAAHDNSLVFLARSIVPRAVFSIDTDTPDVINVPIRQGESFSTAPLGEVRNVVVSHADISGLPAGIVANELRVANGSRSFSVILSSFAADLPAMWQTFLTSIQVTPP